MRHTNTTAAADAKDHQLHAYAHLVEPPPAKGDDVNHHALSLREETTQAAEDQPASVLSREYLSYLFTVLCGTYNMQNLHAT